MQKIFSHTETVTREVLWVASLPWGEKYIASRSSKDSIHHNTPWILLADFPANCESRLGFPRLRYEIVAAWHAFVRRIENETCSNEFAYVDAKPRGL